MVIEELRTWKWTDELTDTGKTGIPGRVANRVTNRDFRQEGERKPEETGRKAKNGNMS